MLRWSGPWPVQMSNAVMASRQTVHDCRMSRLIVDNSDPVIRNESGPVRMVSELDIVDYMYLVARAFEQRNTGARIIEQIYKDLSARPQRLLAFAIRTLTGGRKRAKRSSRRQFTAERRRVGVDSP